MGEESRDKWYAKNALGNGVKGILLWNRDCKLPRRKCNALIKINEGRDSWNANSLSVQGVEAESGIGVWTEQKSGSREIINEVWLNGDFINFHQ